MAAESRRRRRWMVPALLLGAGAGTWVIVRRRSATEPVDVRAPRPPVERMIVAPASATSAPTAGVAPVPAPAQSADRPAPAARPLLAAPTPVAVGVFGPGSAAPLPDGTSPGPEYTIKGNPSSRLFHPPSSPYYGRTKAEVWFRTDDDAVAAGFSPYRSRRR